MLTLTLTWFYFTLEVTALSITSSPDDCGRGSTRRLEIQHSIQTKIQHSIQTKIQHSIQTEIQCKNYKGAKSTNYMTKDIQHHIQQKDDKGKYDG